MPRHILITGAGGRIGTALQALYPNATCIECADIDLREQVPDFRGFDAVIHLASNLDDGLEANADNIRITFNVLRGATRANITRLIWASSMTAEERQIAFPVTWYGRTKRAQEMLLDAWCAEKSERRAVALRFGHFCPGSQPPPEHELLRLRPSGLAFWVGRALSHVQPGLTIWNALGGVDESGISATGNR
ncbi:NAD-dependent epimerase/dehydratase family protein [Methylorubrum extorquens]|uniref:NAD-dependent epimerase/dehydratase family protein n=1 Tax=Methylorubrum extorquens TaxID=408 RepID=UPI001EE4FE78|nr:NAD(P)-dependent oxidoreductase [Methylorubrum extorquens]MCG5247831.1 NAD(P)-dependent oxidoreductase [Methylorubrum extorquens]